MIEQAKKYHSLGLSVIPIDKEKKPIIAGWTKNRIMPNGKFNQAHGIGLVCGQFSGGVEAIDIDCKYDLTGTLYEEYTRLIEEVAPSLLSRLLIQQTRSNGYHFVYRCETIEGNLELASREATENEKKEGEKTHPLIETRGKGGYICIEPSPGYSILQGRLSDIKEITTEERSILFDCARTFNQVFKEAQGHPVKEFSGNGFSPFQDYNHRCNPIELLEAHGWKQVRQVGKFIHVKRPGTTKSLWSASINTETKQLHVFSQSCDFEADKSYSPAAVFCKLEAGDDWKRCYLLLIEKGYGEPQTRISEPIPQKVMQDLTPDEFLNKYASLRISASNPIAMPEAIIKIQGIDVLTPGNQVMVSGPEKCAKTSFLNLLLSGCIATSNGYDGSDKIEIKSNTEGKAIIVIDTEQSEPHSYRNFRNAILRRARIEQEPEHFYYYNIRSLSISEYQPLLIELFRAVNERHGGIFLCAIDGGADFVNDTNDIKESTAKAAFFSQLAMKYKTGIIQVVHLNPGSDKERGHYGSELRRKCESVLAIKKDGDISIIEGKLLRSGGISDFQPLRFKYDQAKHYHLFLDGEYTGNKESKLKELAEFVFTEERRHKAAMEMIMEYEGCSDKTAKNRINQLVAAGLIIRRQGEGKGVLYDLKKQG